MSISAQLILCTILVVAAFYDLFTMKIPNFITFSTAIAGVVFHTSLSGFDGFLFSVCGLTAGIGMLLIPYIRSGMGAGDVKLLGAGGSFLGAKATLGAFIFIAIAGGIYALALIFYHRNAFQGFFSGKLQAVHSMVLLKEYVPDRTINPVQRPRLRYGIAIAIGTVAYLAAQSYGLTLFLIV